MYRQMIKNIGDNFLPDGNSDIKVFILLNGNFLTNIVFCCKFAVLNIMNQEIGFLHTHKNHEELYFFLKGKGEFQVYGRSFPVVEGSVVRVTPGGRSLSQNGIPCEPHSFCVRLFWWQ